MANGEYKATREHQEKPVLLDNMEPWDHPVHVVRLVQLELGCVIYSNMPCSAA